MRYQADPSWAFNISCWPGEALEFATNKGLSCASRKSRIFNSSGLSGFFRNLEASAFSLVLGASYTKRTLFFSFFWIQASFEAKRTSVSCSCIETKPLWLVHFRLRLGVEGHPREKEPWPQATVAPRNKVKGQCLGAYFPLLPPDQRQVKLGGKGLEEGLRRGRGVQECLTLFFTDWFFSSSSMSRSKWNTCGLRIPRTPWQRQKENA